MGLHAICRLARGGGRATARELAEGLGSSSHHMSKVMRKLAVGGIVSVAKGPNGGFYFEDSQLDKSLMDALEAIDGSFSCGGCIFKSGICDRKDCIFADVLKDANAAFSAYLRKTKIGNFINQQKKGKTTL